MLKLKLQYFGHLMQTDDSLEKSLMLGKIEGRRRRHQRKRWLDTAILSSDAHFSSCPQSFPASGTFPMSCLLTSDDQNTETSASASVFPVNIQGSSPLRLTGLISLQSKGLSGVFSSTTVQRLWFFVFLPSLWSSSHNHTWPLGRP